MAKWGTLQGWFFGSVVGALALLGSACAHGGAAKVQSSSVGSGGD